MKRSCDPHFASDSAIETRCFGTLDDDDLHGPIFQATNDGFIQLTLQSMARHEGGKVDACRRQRRCASLRRLRRNGASKLRRSCRRARRVSACWLRHLPQSATRADLLQADLRADPRRDQSLGGEEASRAGDRAAAPNFVYARRSGVASAD